MDIRNCREGEYDKYLSVATACFKNSSWNGVKPDFNEKNLNNIFFGMIDEKIIGFFVISKEPYLEEESISLLGVLPEERRKGYASKLLEEAEKELKKRGVASSIVTFPSFCNELYSFYAKAGYIVDEIKFETQLENGEHYKKMKWKDFSKLSGLKWIICWAEMKKEI